MGAKKALPKELCTHIFPKFKKLSHNVNSPVLQIKKILMLCY